MYSQFLVDLENYIGDSVYEAGDFLPSLKQHKHMLLANVGNVRHNVATVRMLSGGIREHSGDVDGDVDYYLSCFSSALEKLNEEMITPLSKRVRTEQGAKREVARARSAAGEIVDSLTPERIDLEELVESAHCPSILYPVERGGRGASLTVVSVDLAQYTAHAQRLDDLLEVAGVRELNENIRRALHTALDEIGVDHIKVPFISLGDGALIFFEQPRSAIRFAECVHQREARRHLASEDNRKHYRIGLATGLVIAEPYMSNGRWTGTSAAGLPIIDAVRLEAKSPTGAMLICDTTYPLIEEMQDGFERVEVEAKEHENRTIVAWYRQVTPPRDEKELHACTSVQEGGT